MVGGRFSKAPTQGEDGPHDRWDALWGSTNPLCFPEHPKRSTLRLGDNDTRIVLREAPSVGFRDFQSVAQERTSFCKGYFEAVPTACGMSAKMSFPTVWGRPTETRAHWLCCSSVISVALLRHSACAGRWLVQVSAPISGWHFGM